MTIEDVLFIIIFDLCVFTIGFGIATIVLIGLGHDD